MSDPDETQPLEPTSEDDDLATRSSAVDWDNPLRSAPKAVVILIVALLVIVGLVLWAAWRDRSNLAGEVDDLEANNEELASGVEALRGQVEGLGAEPVVELDRDPGEDQPTVVPGPPGATGRPGPPPSDEQVLAAVERYCQTNDCRGPQGSGPTTAQVAAAVARYCDARGECRGPAGPDDPDPDDPDPDDPESDDPEIQDAEIDDPDPDDPDPDDPEIQDPEIQDPEIDDPSIPGPAGPTCPNGADPISWTVDEPTSNRTGLDPGTYLICLAGREQ